MLLLQRPATAGHVLDTHSARQLHDCSSDHCCALYTMALRSCGNLQRCCCVLHRMPCAGQKLAALAPPCRPQISHTMCLHTVMPPGLTPVCIVLDRAQARLVVLLALQHGHKALACLRHCVLQHTVWSQGSRVHDAVIGLRLHSLLAASGPASCCFVLTAVLSQCAGSLLCLSCEGASSDMQTRTQ